MKKPVVVVVPAGAGSEEEEEKEDNDGNVKEDEEPEAKSSISCVPPTSTTKVKKKKKKGRGRDGGCYHCGSINHRGKFCPTTTCRHCNQLGHDIGGCPLKKQQQPVEVDLGQFTPRPSSSFTFVELFAGIGGFRLALERLGGGCVWGSESERKFVVPNYQLNFDGDRPAGDLTQIPTEKIPSHDLLVGGFPCQSFSSSGKRLGLEDTTNGGRGQLYKEIVRILREKQPKAFVLENVRGLLLHNEGQTFATIRTELEDCGYNMVHQVIDASTILPQERKRLFMVGIRNDITTAKPYQFPILPQLHRGVQDILDEDLAPQLLSSLELSQHQIDKVWNQPYTQKYPQARFMEDLTQPTKTLQASYTNYMVNSQFVPVQDTTTQNTTNDNNETTIPPIPTRRWRKFSPREAARLQGFPELFRLCKYRSYHMLGNAVPPPLAVLIVAPLLEIIGIDITTKRETTRTTIQQQREDDNAESTTPDTDAVGNTNLNDSSTSNTDTCNSNPNNNHSSTNNAHNNNDHTTTTTTNCGTTSSSSSSRNNNMVVGWTIAKEMLLEASPPPPQETTTTRTDHDDLLHNNSATSRCRRERLQKLLDQV